MKYIQYRKDRGKYQVKVKVDGKFIIKSANTLQEALIIRESIFIENKLNTSLLIEDNEIINNTLPPVTFEEWGEKYLQYVKDNNSITTYANYLYVINLFSRYIGKEEPRRISLIMLTDIINELNQKNNYSVNYNRMFKRVLNGMYSFAIRSKWLKTNIAKDIQTEGRETIPKRPFTQLEIDKLLTVAKSINNVWYVLFSLFSETGARRGEICALQWCHVHLEEEIPYISIVQSTKYNVIDRKYEDGSTKTKESVRNIPISSHMVSLLTQHKKSGYSSSSYVFLGLIGRAKGKPLNPRSVDTVFRNIADKAKLPSELTLHCFRHTLASRLVSAGIDIVTANKIGGWGIQSKTMLSTYAHADLKQMQSALDIIRKK